MLGCNSLTFEKRGYVTLQISQALRNYTTYEYKFSHQYCSSIEDTILSTF